MRISKQQVWCGFVVSVGVLSLVGCGGSSSAGGGGGSQPVAISIAGSPPSSIGVGANWLYSATLTGGPNQSVTWTASGAGTIDANTGFYVAPNTVPSPATVTITATSQADTTKTASTTVTIQQTDPLGSVTASSTLPSCLGSVTGATCYQLTVSCPGVADLAAYLKVNTPAGTPLGTVLFGVGTGGSGLYDDPVSSGYAYGYQTVQNVLTASSASGYNAVQVSFGGPFDNGANPHGWLQGPGGVRHLACRYATIANWVYNNPATIGLKLLASATTSGPMCATGNSGGSAVIAYAVSEYGLDSEFAMIEPTSGPVMTRIDQGCSPCGASSGLNACTNTQQPMCYSTGGSDGGDAAIIDEAYQKPGASTPTLCTDAINGNPGPDAAALFLSDSILYNPANTISLPGTAVSVLFGDLDTSNAVPQGTVWTQSVSPAPTVACLAGIDHEIPNFSNGAMQIATDIINNCH